MHHWRYWASNTSSVTEHLCHHIQTLFSFEHMDNTDEILRALKVKSLKAELWCSTTNEIFVVIQCFAHGSLDKINCKNEYCFYGHENHEGKLREISIYLTLHCLIGSCYSLWSSEKDYKILIFFLYSALAQGFCCLTSLGNTQALSIQCFGSTGLKQTFVTWVEGEGCGRHIR